MKLEVGMYIRTKKGEIDKILHIDYADEERKKYPFHPSKNYWRDKILLEHKRYRVTNQNITKASHNITDLIEYMDLLEIQNPIKLYGKNTEINLFNPVRCDGFTEFEDGTHCIILDLDYLVDVKDLKVKSILTHEQFENNCYKIGD